MILSVIFTFIEFFHSFNRWRSFVIIQADSTLTILTLRGHPTFFNETKLFNHEDQWKISPIVSTRLSHFFL